MDENLNGEMEILLKKKKKGDHKKTQMETLDWKINFIK